MTLQEEAENILKKLQLVEKLGQFGEVHPVGNVAFGTTIKPDIDIQIYCPTHYEDTSEEIIAVLTDLGLTNIKERRLKRSKKYLILGQYTEGEAVWDIDITLTQPDKRYIRDSYQFYLDYSPKVTPEKLALIMDFKQTFAESKIAGDNPAFYIYLGVLDEGITRLPEMKGYLERMKTSR